MNDLVYNRRLFVSSKNKSLFVHIFSFGALSLSFSILCCIPCYNISHGIEYNNIREKVQ